MDILNSITIEDFKEYFYRGEFNFCPYYNPDEVYNTDDIVCFNKKMYRSLVDNNTYEPIERDYWVIDNTKKYLDYILDEDIEKAFAQAKAIFPINLFNSKDEDTIRMLFYLLVAHFIVKDLDMSKPGGSSSAFLMTSKSVGDVSASYSIPESLLKNPLYSYLSGTPFGLKYLQYMYSMSIGSFRIIKGGVNAFF